MKLIFSIVFSFTLLMEFAQAAPAPAYKLPINFHVVIQGKIYRGARPQSQESVNYLRDIGVKTVIDLQGGDLDNLILGLLVPFFEKGEKPEEIKAEQQTMVNNRMAFYNLPLNSIGYISSDEMARIEQALKIMNDPKSQPVYVHCAYGADRTGLLVALYRVKYQNWSRTEAYAEMIQNGHNLFHMLGTFGMDKYLFTENLRKFFDKYFVSLLNGLTR